MEAELKEYKRTNKQADPELEAKRAIRTSRDDFLL